jgi:uroporphyrinogen decarboxylase
MAGVGNEDDLRFYSLPDIEAPHRRERLREKVEAAHRKGYAVIGYQPTLGGVVFEAAYRLLGFDRFLIELADRGRLAALVMDWLAERCAHNSAALAEADVDILYLGDDVAGPSGLLISPELWKREIRGRLQRIVASARDSKPGVHLAYHSDGDFTLLIPELIDIGFDLFHPVQPDWMNPVVLKAEYGDAVSFWGTVGTHRLLSFGSPEDVREEVRRRMEQMAPGGGFIAAPAYDTHSDVPWRNIVAFFEAAHRYGTY